MMKTESFNWQRPAKICNGVKDFGLLREKFTNANETKRRGFTSLYISRAVFIVGVIAVITFVMCLVLADKYQKSINLSHHYASFVYEKSRRGGGGDRLYSGARYRASLNDNNDNNNDDDNDDDNDEDDRQRDQHRQRGGVFSAPAFFKLQNISNKLPIEEINLLVPATTVLRSLNATRNGRQLSPYVAKIGESTVPTFTKSISNVSTATDNKKHNIPSLADLLRRTELKVVVTSSSSTASTRPEQELAAANTSASASVIVTTSKSGTDASYANAAVTKTAALAPTASTQTSIHFAQLESYPRRTQNDNLQHIIRYINCESSGSGDCWSNRQQNANTPVTTAATAIAIATATATTINTTTTTASRTSTSTSTSTGTGYQNQHLVDETRDFSYSPFDILQRESGKQLDSAFDFGPDPETYIADRNQVDQYQRAQATEQQSVDDDADVSLWSMDRSNENFNGNGSDASEEKNRHNRYDDHHGYGYGYGNDYDDTMFAADTRSAPLYYSSSPYSSVHRNRVNTDPFRNFRASDPLEINRLELDDQTADNAAASTGGGAGDTGATFAAEQMLHHRFSNRMYRNHGGGDTFESYGPDLEPYLKPPTPPPPTTLSFTPAYTTNIFHAFNDPLASAAASASAPQPAFLHDNDLRSEATAVEPIATQIKPISLMVEIFPANEYELPASVFGAAAASDASGDNRIAAQASANVDGGGRDTRSNSDRANFASLMSWKLAPFSQNKMRLLVNLFPHHHHHHNHHHRTRPAPG